MRETLTFVILGASGDLTERLLLPGLGTLLATEPHRDVRLVGVGRRAKSDEAWQQLVREALGRGECGRTQLEHVADSSRWLQVSGYDSAVVGDLLRAVTAPVVVYFALPPHATAAAVSALRGQALPAGVRLALDKPFGEDLASARELNRLITEVVPEEQVFRVDHFLGRATVLNLLGVRFANHIFEPVWRADHIEAIDIIADETLALEGRAGYYDGAGALIDMLQSHLLLVMTLVAMSEPARIEADELHNLMLHTLRSTHVFDDDPVTSSRRGRYVAGRVGDHDVPAYVEEDGVEPDRMTETLAEIVLEIRNQRWAGVPIRLRSGKALDAKRSHVKVRFRNVRHLPEGLGGDTPANVLTIGMTPQHIGLDIATNTDNDRLRLSTTHLDADLGDSDLRPYGEILGRIFDNDHLLSVRGDVAEECWRILEPVIHAWREDRVPLDDYPAGSNPESVCRGQGC